MGHYIAKGLNKGIKYTILNITHGIAAKKIQEHTFLLSISEVESDVQVSIAFVSSQYIEQIQRWRLNIHCNHAKISEE